MVLSSDTEVFFRKKQLVHRHSYHIRINTENGSSVAKVSIPYQKGDKVEILDARLIDPEGKTLKKLRDKEIQDRSNLSSISFYDEGMSRNFELYYHAYPYELVYTYEHTFDKHISLVDWTPILSSNLHIETASLEVKLPLDMNIRIMADPSLSYQVDSSQSEKSLTWTTKHPDLPTSEVLSAPPRNRIPFVKIAPLEFEYGLTGKLDTWKSFGEWLNALNQYRGELTAQEKTTVDKLIRDASTESEIIEILYSYMQDNTRYISVALGIGGMQPHPAIHVCKNKYGDCKDLTNYMQALLSYAGIQSYYVVVNAGDPISKIDRQFPSQQFNHVILCVPLKGDTIWLENTSDTNPPGYLGTFTQNRIGLLVDEHQSRLINIPALDSSGVLSESRYTIKSNSEANGFHFEMHGRYRGDKYEYIKHALEEGDQQVFKSVLRYIIPFPIDDITNVSAKEHPTPKIDVTSIGTLDRYIRHVGNQYFAPVPPLDIPELETIESRTSPVQIDYPLNIIDTIVIQGKLSPDFDLPEKTQISGTYGSYSDEFVLTHESIQMIRKYQIKAGNYPLNEYEKFYEFIGRLKKHTENLFISFSL